MEIFRQMQAYAVRQQLVQPRDRILVAVSGGPDSVALLHLLYELRGEMDLHLEVAHLQHGIRGAAAKSDARFVADLAGTLRIPFHLKETDLPRMKHDAGRGNLEALARAERYRFFAAIAENRQLEKVATAHTRDDQAETVIMWLLRGAGTKGLGGMAPRHKLKFADAKSARELTVIRPLLETSKAEVLQYLSERQLEYCVDQSNHDLTFLRNWIRSELLPKISQRIDPHVPARLAQLGELLRDEDEYLAEIVRCRCDLLFRDDGMDRTAFLAEPKALQRRILRVWLGQTRGHLHGLGFGHIEDMLRLIAEGPPQGRIAIPGGWELERQYELLQLNKRARKSPRICYSYPLEVGSVLTIPEARLQFHSRSVNASSASRPASLMEAVFALTDLDKGLSVRNFRNGDRFRPLGMSGHKKVKDLFIEKRVPLPIRACWPLLAYGEEILWIPGYGRSEVGRVMAETTAVLELKAVTVPS